MLDVCQAVNSQTKLAHKVQYKTKSSSYNCVHLAPRRNKAFICTPFQQQ